MTPSQIIARARRGIADTSNYPDSDGIIDFNFIYQDLVSEIITELDEDYFYNIGTAPTVANQIEYNIKEVGTSTKYKINEINKLFIKYSSTDTYRTPIRRVDPNSLTNTIDRYAVNQPKTDPIYYVQGDYTRIFPMATESVADGLEIHVIYQPADLTINSTEADILIPPRFHQVIEKGIRPLIFNTLNQTNEENDAKVKYEEAKRDLVVKMRNRNQWVIEISVPSSVFKYT